MEINEILQIKLYTKADLADAAVILHPKHIEKYKVAPPDVGLIFEQGSNFTRLKNPILDEAGNQYHDSEAYYMAQRFSDPNIRKMISLCSTHKNFSKKAAYLLKDQMEIDVEKNRIHEESSAREIHV